jgi:hypothetical protein
VLFGETLEVVTVVVIFLADQCPPDWPSRAANR